MSQQQFACREKHVRAEHQLILQTSAVTKSADTEKPACGLVIQEWCHCDLSHPSHVSKSEEQDMGW